MSVDTVEGFEMSRFPLTPAPLPLARERGAELRFEALHNDQPLSRPNVCPPLKPMVEEDEV